MAENPYAAPAATVEDVADWDDDFALAGRGSRLLAWLVNMLTIAVPGIIAALVVPATTKGQQMGTLGLVVVGLLSIWILVVVIVDIVLLYRNGQSIGKKVMNVKIVRTNGDRCALWRILLLRIFVNGLISGIPLVGKVYGLIDVLFIFNSERRCIHDYIADTIVIKA